MYITAEIVDYFIYCIKLNTEIKKIEDLFDVNGEYNGEYILYLKTIEEFEKNINIYEIDVVKLVDHWSISLEKNKNNLIFLETYTFLNWLLNKLKSIDINKNIDFLNHNFIELENIFISILNNLDKMSFLYKIILETLENDKKRIFDDVNKNVVKKENLYYFFNPNKKTVIKSFSFYSVLYKKFKLKYDISEFYTYYLYEKRNEITHRSRITYFYNTDQFNQVAATIVEKKSLSGISFDFCRYIKYSILYSIVVTYYINEELNQIF
ncbi:hypothetical protein SGLAD_v1c06240 [Spiroplasma gladiatoris]|uniref:Uncharacterized protein n=1 Tax=Spiroplasma gladiatoris TaxID=2143 RepID=A0A4P7AJA8_9MOLU|nr:hypothetical protein [Spiroplasma gladiatoris]QBQ07823.1 hypothetical protein SGLAD_v1c06240 [Spiroplasma gladiatoris]